MEVHKNRKEFYTGYSLLSLNVSCVTSVLYRLEQVNLLVSQVSYLKMGQQEDLTHWFVIQIH